MASIARLCLIGPECTGKTTLAQRLAGELGEPWSAEFAREYALRVGCVLTAADVEPIANGQLANEDVAAAAAKSLVVLDTDLVSTMVYARHYYGACPEWIERAAVTRRANRYLLLDTDVPWIADAARDAGDADAREDVFDRFRATLDELECSWSVVSGGWDERWADAKRAGQLLYTSLSKRRHA
jgi:NadR type nicotinamide-nucleotide adenylyltransferase